MVTINSIKLANEDNIRSKVLPGSITKSNDADMRDVVANELRDRGMIAVATTADLATQSHENTMWVVVDGTALFKALQTVDAADGFETYASADAGWLWRKYFDVSAAMSKVELVVEEDGAFVLPDGFMMDKILMKPTAADTVRIGTTEGGQEIKFDEELAAGVWTSVNYDVFADGGDVTIYFTGFTAATKILIYIRKL